MFAALLKTVVIITVTTC